MTAYAETVETVVGGGPRVTPPAPVPPLPADALRAPSRLANIIDEAIDDKQWGRPQAPEPKGGTHITVSSGTIDCTLVGGTHTEIVDEAINCTLVGGEHITINGEDIDHDAPGPQHTQIATSGVWVVANAWIDSLGHVRLD